MSGSWTVQISSPRSLQKCNKFFCHVFDPRTIISIGEITKNFTKSHSMHVHTCDACAPVRGHLQPPPACAASAHRAVCTTCKLHRQPNIRPSTNSSMEQPLMLLQKQRPPSPPPSVERADRWGRGVASSAWLRLHEPHPAPPYGTQSSIATRCAPTDAAYRWGRRADTCGRWGRSAARRAPPG